MQAVNVLILVWLLSRVFWRPVAEAIARRQDTVEGILKDAKAAQAKADDFLAEVIATREGMAAERNTLLTEAALQADAAAKATRDVTVGDNRDTVLIVYLVGFVPPKDTVGHVWSTVGHIGNPAAVHESNIAAEGTVDQGRIC